MKLPNRLRRQAGRYALVDDIPFELPVGSQQSAVIMAGFPVSYERARAALPGTDVHPLRLGRGRALLLLTVVDYRQTCIGKYIEYSIGLACTHGPRPAPPLVPGVFRQLFGTGQYVLDLPVSTEISVKGGKGIWGMPKHQASLDFVEGPQLLSSQYDQDGELVMRLDVQRPTGWPVPLRLGTANYCQFRGMLLKSAIYFEGKARFTLFQKQAARITLGRHPRAEALRALGIVPEAVFTAYMPHMTGVLDDHIESWFLSYDHPPTVVPEGLESIVNLNNSEAWLPAPCRAEPVPAAAPAA
jgi:hypothetical protein